jgi:hypothetical protein
MHLINLNKELSYYLEKGEAADLRYAEMLKKDIADARAELDKRIKSKKGTNEAKEEDKVKFKKGNTVFDKHTKAKLKVTRIVKDRIYTVPFNFPGRAEEWYKAEDLTTKSFFTEQEEDPTDIIAMDVPLFLRMLEYAREDAEQDVDLHKVTERAIEAVKLRGLLSMEDYQDIIGEPIDEEIDYLSLKDDNPFDDVPSIDIQMIDDKEGVSSPKAFVNFSSMYHSGDNGKMEILRNNPALQDKVMQTLQAEFQKTFRRVIHGVLGEPFGLDEMTGYSKYLATPENPKSKTPGLPPSIMDKILMEISTMRDNDREETIRLGEGLIEEELCAKGKAYRKRRIAAGEKSSAYLSGRAVKVCKGQMSGKKKKVNEESDARNSAIQAFQKMPIGKVIKTTKGDFKKIEADKFENISTKVKYNSAQMSYTTPSTK